MKVGILLGSLETGSLKKDLQRAMAIGAHGVQLWAMDNELDPRNLSGTGREELVDYLDSLGLELSAVGGELGGLDDAQAVDEQIARGKGLLDLCLDLRTCVLTADIGPMPEDPASRAHAEFAEAVRELGNYALNREMALALDTGRTSPAALAAFIESMKCDGVRVNYDPGSLCMSGHDAIEGVATLGKYIVHTQATDGVYASRREGRARETQLGRGDVHFSDYLAALRETGYRGYLTIKRDAGENRVAEIVEAVTYLQRQEGVEP